MLPFQAKRFSTLPALVLLTHTIFGILALIAGLMNRALTHYDWGFTVRTLQSLREVQAGSGDEPLVVRIDKRRHYFLNNHEITAKNLPAALEQSLHLRLKRVVFVYAERDAEYGDVVFAVGSNQPSQCSDRIGFLTFLMLSPAI